MRSTKQFSLFAAIAASVLFASVGTASAASVTYDFTDSVTDFTTTPLSPSLVPLVGIEAQPGGTLTQTPLGLGVYSVPLEILTGTWSQINFLESVQFDFNPNVSLQSISFTAFLDNTARHPNIGDNPTVQYLSATTNTWSDIDVTHIVAGNAYTFTGAATASDIAGLRIGANDLFDSFAIGSLTVNYDPTSGSTPPSAVPLPAAATSGLALLAALGLAAGLRKKLAL